MAFLTPDYYFSTVQRIDPSKLYDQGFRVVLLDIDNTLVSRETHALTEETKAWVASLAEHGLRACLLSNNWHRVVFRYAEELNVPIVYKAMKPLPFSYKRCLKKLGHSKGEKIIAVGDQIVTDVWGAHLCGIPAILVEPLAEKDLWYTTLFRKFEHLLLRGKQPRK